MQNIQCRLSISVYLFADAVTDRSHEQWNDEASNINNERNDHDERLKTHKKTATQLHTSTSQRLIKCEIQWRHFYNPFKKDRKRFREPYVTQHGVDLRLFSSQQHTSLYLCWEATAAQQVHCGVCLSNTQLLLLIAMLIHKGTARLLTDWKLSDDTHFHIFLNCKTARCRYVLNNDLIMSAEIGFTFADKTFTIL